MAVVAASQQPRRQLQRASLTDAVVREGAAVLQLLARVREVLIVKDLAALAAELVFDGADDVRRLGLHRQSVACDGSDEKLKNEMVHCTCSS
jgi:hypothetical protein